MKIVSLIAENVKKLVAVEITPDGNLVTISGKNGQGKTSVLDSIWWALAGASHIQAAPIRKGAKNARIRLDLGEIIVTRTFSRKEDGGNTTSITVENAEGARFPSPQKMLDSLLGELTFDPLAFARMDGKSQFNALRKFVPGVDFEAIDNANRGDFQRRAEVNKLAKEARGAASMIVVPENTSADTIDESALVDEMQEAGKHNAQIEARKARRETVKRDAENLQAEANELRAEVEALLAKADASDKRASEMRAQLDAAEALPLAIDVTEIRAKIDSARMVNAHVNKLATKVRHQQLAAKLEAESDEITARMAEREQEKRAAIAKAHMPVDGIEFGDGLVLLNGVPFEQASDAEQLRASVAIAAAMNPKLRVIRVRDGSLLDEQGMQLLAELADASDMQVWVERVDSSGKIGFVLEDGQVRKAAEEVAA